MTKMDVAGETIPNFDGLSTLIEAAKFLERQEMQKETLRSLESTNASLNADKSLPACEAVDSISDRLSVERMKMSPSTVSDLNLLPSSLEQQQSHPPLRLGTREVHNKLEKNRRAHLKQCFELLRKQVPIPPDEKKISNLNILHSATKYIQTLRRKDREYEYELEKLARQKISLQQQLSVLKRERSEAPMTSVAAAAAAASIDELRRNNILDRDSRVTSPQALYSVSSSPPVRSNEHILPQKIQVVPAVGRGTSTASSASLLVSSGSTVQLLPSSALRGIPVPNGVLSHSRVTLATSDSSQLIQQAAHMVISQSNGGGQVLLPLTSPTIGGKMLQMPVVNLVKPAVVVVSSPSNSTH